MAIVLSEKWCECLMMPLPGCRPQFDWHPGPWLTWARVLSTVRSTLFSNTIELLIWYFCPHTFGQLLQSARGIICTSRGINLRNSAGINSGFMQKQGYNLTVIHTTWLHIAPCSQPPNVWPSWLLPMWVLCNRCWRPSHCLPPLSIIAVCARSTFEPLLSKLIWSVCPGPWKNVHLQL